MPAAVEIVALFSSWQAALKVSEVETNDAVCGDEEGAPWAASEVRRLVDQAETLLQQHRGDDYELDEEGWELICSRSRRRLPSWPTVKRLLCV